VNENSDDFTKVHLTECCVLQTLDFMLNARNKRSF